jgi:hypothetical protein
MLHDRRVTDRGAGLPNLSFVIPAANENRWSDLLATLVNVHNVDVRASTDLVFPAFQYADPPRISWHTPFGNMSRLHSRQIGDRAVPIHRMEDVRSD